MPPIDTRASERDRPTVPTVCSPLRAEFVATLALAWPLVLTNVAQMGLATADVVLTSRLGAETLAAGALATNLYFAFAFLGFGLVSATAPLMAEALGRKTRSIRDVRRTVRQGLWVCCLVALPLWVLLWNGERILIAFGEPPLLASQAGDYLRVLEWGLLPLFGFSVLRQFLSALERPGWPLAVGLGAIPVNVGLAVLLIWGGWGIPALGLVGAGIATTVTAFLMVAALAGVIVLHSRFRRWRLFGRWWRPDLPRLRHLLQLGLPIAATLLFETGVFNAAAFVMGLFGPTVLAAHAVALQIAALTFMVPLGIAQAATVRVGLAFGARDPDGISRAGRAALTLAVAFMSTTALLFVLAPDMLVSAFLDADVRANAGVIELAAGFLLFAALFQVADGLQAVGSGLLRGVQDARMPMLLAGLGYWGIGAPLGLFLAFPCGLGGRGIWIGLATGLIVVAALMLRRWHGRTVWSPAAAA